MSDALNYLLKARPEAMGHYFRFLKDAGSKLDPKTRSLISVITKVHSQTERGLLQYTKRALGDGASAEEILDALLMAFPALGLAKIVWAVDVLLASGLPEFRMDATGPAAWHGLGKLDAFAAPLTRTECEGRTLLVYHANGAWTVYDNHCPHQRTPIPLEALEGGALRCPKHGWTFDIATGECTAKGDRPLKRYPSRVENGALFAEW
ncbi:MAG: Rieske 2Fe-2S domain-containing protein [Burkholderiales bacterium]